MSVRSRICAHHQIGAAAATVVLTIFMLSHNHAHHKRWVRLSQVHLDDFLVLVLAFVFQHAVCKQGKVLKRCALVCLGIPQMCLVALVNAHARSCTCVCMRACA